ncbi:hypothetical protein [Uliginosibacterium sediminicola]|uniref:Peptidase M48 domain-containing protein n=1 Tax=Uliginosibacterium sediminicola TaxID=2024550 RepID=A0ABU9YY78_9RHOO
MQTPKPEPDPAAAPHLPSPEGQLTPTTSWLQRQGHRLLLGLLSLALVVTAAGSLLGPTFTSTLSRWIPGTWVYAAAVQTLQRMDGNGLQPSLLTVDEQSAINAEFAALRLPGNEVLPYELTFRDTHALGTSAFTLAGGIIVVSDELVARSSRRELMSRLLLELGYLHKQNALHAVVVRNPLRILFAVTVNQRDFAVQLLSSVQPILEHDADSTLQAQQFRDSVLDANPQLR